MKISRTYILDVDTAGAYRIGDKLQLGKYTATCQKVRRSASIFMLDQYLDEPCRMNPTNTSKGGYEESELRKTLQTVLAEDENFAELKEHLRPFDNGDLFRIPTVGEMFGNDDLYEMDDAEQWELMKDRRNHIAAREGMDVECGWLQNRAHISAALFASVGNRGHASYSDASYSDGVRPVFQLFD